MFSSLQPTPLFVSYSYISTSYEQFRILEIESYLILHNKEVK